MAPPPFAQPWIEFEKELGTRPWLPGPTIEDVLTGWEKLAGTMVSKLTFPAPDQTVKTEERTIDHSIKVRIYYPPGYTGGKHVGVYFHGGGWVLGDLNIDDADCRELAKRAGSVLISIDYRLAPQNVFPASVDDCFAGAIWAAKNAASLGGVSDQVFLIGDSAGGQLAICTALKMIDEGYRSSLKGLIPLEPPTIHPKALPTDLEPIYTSYDDYTDRTVDSKPAMIAFYDAYAGRPDHVYVSPLLHPKIGELPKVFMTANEIDTLRDDARLFKAKLEKQGVPHKYTEFQGYPHNFWHFPSSHLDEAREMVWNKVVSGIQWVCSD